MGLEKASEKGGAPPFFPLVPPRVLTSLETGRLQMPIMWLYALSRDMNEEKKYFSSLVEIEIALFITSAVFSFFIEVILHTSIVN